MGPSGGNKCRGCKVKVKQHKFGPWGPDCTRPPDCEDSGDEKINNGVLLQHLRLITDRLDNLEKSSSSGATDFNRKVQDVPSSDEEVSLEDMTREQMLQFIKNSKKGQDEMAKVGGAGKPAKKKNVKIGEPKKRRLSLSNLFNNDYLRDQDQLNLRSTADKLKAKHQSKQNDDNRIGGVPVIDDLRRDPGLLGQAGEWLRDAGGRAS